MLFRRLLGRLPGHYERCGRRDLRPRAPTRQELALTLFRYAKEAGLDTKKRAELTPYSDADQVAGWAREAVEWAVAQGLLAGRSAGGVQTLAPLGTVTRAEFSAVLKTLCETVLPKQ